jgi:hypothetical protein
MMPTSFRMVRQGVLALGAVAIIALAAGVVSRMDVGGLAEALRQEPVAVVSGLGMAAMAVATPFVVAALAPRTPPGVLVAAGSVSAVSLVWYRSVLLSDSSTAALGFVSGPVLALAPVGIVLVAEWLARRLGLG